MALEDDDIEFIKKQYLFCAPINKFSFTAKNAGSHGALDYNTQIKIFENTIQDPGSRKYPSRLSYRIAFLRMLIEKAEKSGQDVYDKLYESLTSYMMLNDDASAVHYRQFLLPRPNDTADRIILQESKSLISEGTTGLRTWQAGFALAEWCNVHESQIRDRLVLELGSGVGLTGLSVVKTCSPKRYIFSDCHSSVLDMLVKNVRLNFATDEENGKIEATRTVEWNEESYKTNHRGTDIRITRLDWSAVRESDVHDSWASPEVVLAADVVYDESLFDEFIEALTVFRTRTDALVIVAATVRNEETISKFLDKLGEYGLSHEDETVPKPQLFLQCDETPVRILRIFNKR